MNELANNFAVLIGAAIAGGGFGLALFMIRKHFRGDDW